VLWLELMHLPAWLFGFFLVGLSPYWPALRFSWHKEVRPLTKYQIGLNLVNLSSLNRLLIFFTVATCAGSTYAGNTMAGPARFWVSPSPTDPYWSGLALSDTLEIDLLANPQDVANSKATLYIWAQPATDSMGNFKQLQNMTLDVISRAPLIDFLDGEALLDNPLSRFSTVRDGDTQFENNPDLALTTKTPSEILDGEPDEILGLQGLNLSTSVPSLDPSVGIGPDCVSSELCVSTSHGPSAWQIGSFGVQSIGLTGSVAIHLQIGAGGMNHLNEAGDMIESTSLTNVIFSATSQTPVYNAGPGPDSRQFTDFANDEPEVLIHISDQLAGDYNANGAVDGADFLAWQRTFSTSATLPNRRIGQTGVIGQGDLFAWEANYGKISVPAVLSSGDFDDDGDVDGADFLYWQRGESPLPLSASDLANWQANYGLSGVSPVNSISVPEPSGLLLALWAVVIVTIKQFIASEPQLSRPNGKSRLPAQSTRKRILKRVLPQFGLLVMLVALQSSAFADEIWWTNQRGDDLWDEEDNWSLNADGSGNVDVSNSTFGDAILHFNADGVTNSQTINLDFNDNRRAGGMLFRSPGSVNFYDTDDVTLILGEFGIFFETGAGNVEIDTDVELDASQTWSVAAGSQLTIGKELNMRGEIDMNGIGDENAPGLIVDGTGEVIINSDFVDSTVLRKTGTGTLTLNGRSQQELDNIQLQGGRLQFADPDKFSFDQELGFSSGILGVLSSGQQFDFDFQLEAVVGTPPLASRVVDTSSFATKISGDISGADGFTKQGVGTLTLTGNNTYVGTTRIEEGKLTVDSISLPTSGGVILEAGAELELANAGSFGAPGQQMTLNGGTVYFLNAASGLPTIWQGNIDVTANSTLFATLSKINNEVTGNITGSNGLTMRGFLTLSGNNTYSGGTTIATGGVFATNASSLGTGDVTISTNATLAGTPTIGGNVTNSGRVAPGNSPGIIVINGDYTQTATGNLEIEIRQSETPGGGVAGVDFDQVQVGGTATLGGTITVLPIDGYAPTSGDAVTVLTAGTVNTSITPELSAPGLDAYNQNSNPNADLALKVSASPAVGPTSVVVEYVDKTSIEFIDGTDTANWFFGTGWDAIRSPESFDETVVTGTRFDPQRVEVTANADVHSLRVEDVDGGVTIDVMSGNTLNSVAGNVIINAGGAIELNEGTLKVSSTQMVEVKQSGMLAGAGTINGAVEVGTTAGSSGATLSPGMNTIGMEVGTLDITGNYSQGAGGVFAIDITGDNSGGNNDFVDVSGEVILSGKLMVDVSELMANESSVGDRYEILRAGTSLTGEFDDVVITGSGGKVFRILYEELSGALMSNGELAALANGFSYSAYLVEAEPGDASGDGTVDDIDAQAFAAAILDLTLGFNYIDNGPQRVSSVNMALTLDFTGDGFIDLDDIQGFVDAYAMFNSVSTATAYGEFAAAFAQVEASRAVPEPTSAQLYLFAMITSLFGKRRLRRNNN